MLPTVGQRSQATKPGFLPWPECALQPAAAALAGLVAMSAVQQACRVRRREAYAGPQNSVSRMWFWSKPKSIYLLRRAVRRKHLGKWGGRSSGVQEAKQPAVSQSYPRALGTTECWCPSQGMLGRELPPVHVPGSSSWLRDWLPVPLLAGKGVDAWSCCSARHSGRTSASGSVPVCSWGGRSGEV